MKKVKGPWYGVAWIIVWTAALAWLLHSGMFDTRESVGLLIVWFTLVLLTVYAIVKQVKAELHRKPKAKAQAASQPALNAPCPCGSGLKYKRCCGQAADS